MPRRCFFVLACLPLATACLSDRMTGMDMHSPATTDAAALLHRGVNRPAGGQCDGDTAALPPLAGDAPNLLRLRIDFVCNFMHLGRTTASVEHLVTFTGPTTATTAHETTYRAANGDLLYARWTGTASFDGPTVTITGQEVYDGGTGRFAGATGSATATGTSSLITYTGQLTWVGTISY